MLAYDDLRDWIKALERAGELERISTEADPILEIAEITDRVSKSVWGRGSAPAKPAEARQPGGSALLFENIKGYPGQKLLINQFGSAARMRLALEVDSLEFASPLERLDPVPQIVVGQHSSWNDRRLYEV